MGASTNHSLWRVACSFTSLISKTNSSSTVCACSNSLLWKTLCSTLGRWVAYHSLKWNRHPCIQEGIFTHVEWIILIATKQTFVKILQHVWSSNFIARQSVSLIFEINMYWQIYSFYSNKVTRSTASPFCFPLPLPVSLFFPLFTYLLYLFSIKKFIWGLLTSHHLQSLISLFSAWLFYY